MPNIATISGVTAAAIATGDTLVVSYPTGMTRGDFVLGVRHRLSVIGSIFSAPENMTVALGATQATITYNGATTIPAGSRFTVELDRATRSNPLRTIVSAIDRFIKSGLAAFMQVTQMIIINLGTPTAASATAICAAQAIAGAGAAILNGAKVVSGVAYLGAPTGRTLVAVSSNAGDTTQILTITGLDIYGQIMREAITLNGTTIKAGKKAFASVTGIAVSAALAGNLTVGDGAILGLPVFLSNSVFIIKETQDGALATSGTLVAGLATVATSTSADVRGTYAPNSAPDGTRSYALLAAIPDTDFYGQPQY